MGSYEQGKDTYSSTKEGMSWQTTLLSAKIEEFSCIELTEHGRLATEAVFVHFKLECRLLISHVAMHDVQCNT